MRFAIYNKNKNYLRQLKQIIYRYAEKYRLDVLIECFENGKDLLASKNRYHIVFLDYDFKCGEGLKIANELTEKYSYCSIIFTGRKGCFDNNIFTVPLNGYLIYPIEDDDVFFTLDNYFRKRKNGYPLLIKSGVDTVCLNINAIIYLEADNKHCRVHLWEETINCSQTMAALYNGLPKRLFLKINRYTVVNSEYVDRFNSIEVILKTGERLYISRTYRKDFKDNYHDFIGDKCI